MADAVLFGAILSSFLSHVVSSSRRLVVSSSRRLVVSSSRRLVVSSFRRFDGSGRWCGVGCEDSALRKDERWHRDITWPSPSALQSPDRVWHCRGRWRYWGGSYRIRVPPTVWEQVVEDSLFTQNRRQG